MFYEYTTRQMTDLIFEKLSSIGDTETLLSSPTNENIFPCRAIEQPLESVNNSIGAVPIRKTFQISVEHWADTKRKCMEMSDKTDLKLREINIIRTNSTPIIFNEITKKYNFVTTYEVRFNGILNQLECIR